jgi:hypothetical protein
MQHTIKKIKQGKTKKERGEGEEGRGRERITYIPEFQSHAN